MTTLGQSEATYSGLSLDECFARMMALGERHYAFVRTGWAMQLLMTNCRPGEPIFCSEATSDTLARQDIKQQVCKHGLGQFTVVQGVESGRSLVSQNIAAE